MNQIFDLLDRFSPRDEVTDRRVQRLRLGIPLHATRRRFGQGWVLSLRVTPDGVQRLQDLVGGGRATFKQALMRVAAHIRGDVHDPALAPPQILLDGVANERLPLLRPQRRTRDVLVDQFT